MTATTLTLIVSLCTTEQTVGDTRGDLQACIRGAESCVKYHKSEKTKRIKQCVGDARNDMAANWATREGYRQTKKSPYPWSMELW